MKICDCCKQPVQSLQTIEKAKICKQCFSKISTSAWKEDKYDNNDDVEKNRQKVLKIASKNGFPPIVIDSIKIILLILQSVTNTMYQYHSKVNVTQTFLLIL